MCSKNSPKMVRHGPGDSDVDSLFNGLDSDNSGAVEIKELFDTVAITM